MTVLKQYDGTGTVSDPNNWTTIFVGTGPTGPPGADSTVPGPTGPTGATGATGPAPPVVSLTRAAYNALSPPDPDTIYVITNEGGVLLTGTGAPAAGLGFDGDLYYASASPRIYGPKASGSWGAGVPLVASSPRTVNTYSATAVTAVIEDAGAYVRCTGTNPTYTIPPNSSVAFVVGSQIDGVGTATTMTLAQGAGVTINKPRTFVTAAADSSWTIIKVATNEWDLRGDFV